MQQLCPRPAASTPVKGLSIHVCSHGAPYWMRCTMQLSFRFRRLNGKHQLPPTPGRARKQPPHLASSSCTFAASTCTICCAFFRFSIRLPMLAKGLPPPSCTDHKGQAQIEAQLGRPCLVSPTMAAAVKATLPTGPAAHSRHRPCQTAHEGPGHGAAGHEGCTRRVSRSASEDTTIG